MKRGKRWATGAGIALGGTGGALAALLGGSDLPPAVSDPAPIASVAPASAPAAPAASTMAAAEPPAALSASASVNAPSAASASASASASARPAASGSPAPRALPALDSPTTPEALHKAALFCDQKKDFDECERAAQAHETGSAGPINPVQAKRFRRIALTHLVSRCETGIPHACSVLAAKYRAGTELPQNPRVAETLEKRAAQICKLRPSDPYCAP